MEKIRVECNCAINKLGAGNVNSKPHFIICKMEIYSIPLKGLNETMHEIGLIWCLLLVKCWLNVGPYQHYY